MKCGVKQKKVTSNVGDQLPVQRAGVSQSEPNEAQSRTAA